MNTNNRFPLALFFLRLGIFVVMFIRTIDKFISPEHAAAVYKNFYFISGLSNTVMYVIGVLELIIIAGFLLGFKKRWTYGTVFILHGFSTLISFKKYLAPFDVPNLLFFTAWPMLAACFALYYLRDQDTLWVIEKK